MGVAGELTLVEQALVEAVSRGAWLNAGEVPGVRDRTCRATVIRDILRGRLAADADPHGLRLRGARITGRLDLENLSTKVNFELTDCLLEQGILAREARMGSVRLRGCRLEHPTDPPLDAAGLACSALDLSRATIIGHTAGKPGEADPPGAVHLRGARIRGHLDCTGAELCNDNGPALLADGVRVGLGMFLRRGFTATGAGQDGAVLLRGTSVGIHLVCSGASLRNDTGPALSADGLQVAQDMYLDEGFTAAGTVNLTSADISGQLSCRGARLNGRDKYGNALLGERMRVGGDVFLEEKFTTTAGAVCLLGADISGKLSCRGAQLNGTDIYGNALHGEAMKVSDRVLLEKFTAAGAVSLLGADISGQLSCRGAQLNGRDKKRNALHGERMKVGGDVLLQEKFTTTAGAVCLLGADISGQLSCHGAQLNGTDEDGNALHGDGIRVGRDVLLDAVLDKNSCPTEKFSASGAISLASARAGTLRWAPGQQISEEVNLRSATVGELSDDWGNGSANGHWPKDGRLSLDGFTYGRLSGNQPDSVEDRLNWIRGQYPESPAKRRRLAWVRALFWNSSAKSQLGFATQPYEQLTAVYRQAGQDDKAREVAIARRKDLRKYGNLNWYSKFGNWFLYWSIGYGYRTWRAAVGLAALFVIFLALSIVGQHQHAIVPTKAKDINGLKPVPSATQCTSNYPCFYPAGYAIDKVLPIIKVYQADYWVPDGNAPWGWFWVGQTWVATGAGWALVTLLVVGYTGLVRRD